MRSARGADAVSFDSFAARYARRDLVTGGFSTEWLRGVLANRHGATAIDLGCGSGSVAEVISGHYERVRGIDLSPRMIDVARRLHPNPAISFEVGDLTQVEGSYDLVVSMMALHHLADQPAAIRHLTGMGNPGGLAIVADVLGSAPRARVPHYRWAAKELAKDVRDAYRRFRVNTERSWVEHLMTDTWLDPDEFASTCRAGASDPEISGVAGVGRMVWERPA